MNDEVVVAVHAHPSAVVTVIVGVSPFTPTDTLVRDKLNAQGGASRKVMPTGTDIDWPATSGLVIVSVPGMLSRVTRDVLTETVAVVEVVPLEGEMLSHVLSLAACQRIADPVLVIVRL